MPPVMAAVKPAFLVDTMALNCSGLNLLRSCIVTMSKMMMPIAFLMASSSARLKIVKPMTKPLQDGQIRGSTAFHEAYFRNMG